MPNEDDNIVQPGSEVPSNPQELDSDSLEAPEGEAPAGASPAGPSPNKPKKPGLGERLHNTTNLYLAVFVLLIIAAAGVVYVTVKSSKPKDKTAAVSSLTDQQLSALKGNTTLVGDAKQTLDVQSNSIFEGQVLLRSDLNVAGTIKVGGGLSLSSITIGGAGNFGQLAVNGGLNVGGDTILQGQLTVQKGLTVAGSASFGSLAASQLSVSSLQLKGDLLISRHLVTSGGNPGRSNGSALGSGGTSSVNGSDTAGTVNINTGGSPPAGCFVTINFVQKYGTTPHVIISPSNSSASSLQYYTNRSTSSFSICSANGPAAGTNYTFDYAVFD